MALAIAHTQLTGENIWLINIFQCVNYIRTPTISLLIKISFLW